ncbi:hypothetical protein H5J25_01985 [Sphingomonas aliaeris]|uniref:DUF4268 domain-containing protein n=1 Tax=Sphingomonas aliaeris TaxID=2759526 RepID=A0A974NV67_9SPHN|nr:hypothetical protein [Sphingomonas aliaeris]QQV77599.1 hypothetical protein H5J25_01985 [Sphingomonas aliaeris]
MTLVLIENDAAQVVRRVPQGEARREATLRDMIADHPEMLPVHDLDPSYGRLITVTKELSIPGVGFVDVLLMDEHGRLVVVECKLWRNPQARREVVGQILDYAREISRFGYEDLQRQVSIATKRQGNVLHALASEAGGTLGEAEFVDRVSRDLAAGRFLLLIVGDGIAEGTRRIGEYLRDQPGLAFSFALIEMAEYRHTDTAGAEHLIVHPRVLAQTATIERWVIRSEIPGSAIESATPSSPSIDRTDAVPRNTTKAVTRWQAFMAAFTAETVFDDPGQPPPRWGGTGWLKVPLPHGLYVNVYRSSTQGTIGTYVRFDGAEGQKLWAAILHDRETIDGEFKAQDLGAPNWVEGDAPGIGLSIPSPDPWDDRTEVEQRRWMSKAANQMVNSLRPRLQQLGRDIAA